MNVGELNLKWIAIALPALLVLGGWTWQSQQTQIDILDNKVWELQSNMVTENKLNVQIQQITEYINVRVSSLEDQQRETNRQLQILSDDVKASTRESRETMMVIREALAEKADRE